MAIFIAIMSGCGASGETRNNEGVDIIESFRSIKGMEPYLDELGEMDYQGTTEISVKDGSDVAAFYNASIAIYKDREVTAEWNDAALSTYLAFFPGLATKASAQEGRSTYRLDYGELLDCGGYHLYVFAYVKIDLRYKREKIIDVIIEKGTETSDTPHIFIYEFERITGASRTDMMLPYSDKVYMDVTELAPSSTESTLDIEWYDNIPRPTNAS